MSLQHPTIQDTNVVPEVDLLSRNKDLAEVLGLIASYYYIARDTYRAKTYANASAKIAAFPQGIVSGAQARASIKGIGDSVEADINEYLKNYDEETGVGTLNRLQELESRFSNARSTIDYFKSFYGIGPVTAAKFYNAGFRTLEDLWFKANLTDAQRVGIMWRDHISLRIPRSEMDIINQTIGSILDPYGIKWSIAGSYRRNEQSSGDIDVLVEARPDLNMDGIVRLLQPHIPAILAQGEKVFMGIFRLDEMHNGHRIDIKLIDHSSYPFALLHYTGSQMFNILMRQRAIEFGMSLNEYGLFSQNTSYPANSEEDIFGLLKVRYMPPEARTKTIDKLEYLQ
jgi:DNA polymerase/3'-5' exonuclease PolX